MHANRNLDWKEGKKRGKKLKGEKGKKERRSKMIYEENKTEKGKGKRKKKMKTMNFGLITIAFRFSR